MKKTSRLRACVSGLTLVVLLAASGACDKNPAAPSAPSQPPASPVTPTLVSWELTGVATGDDGRPISNGSVRVNFGKCCFEAMTDETGRYHVGFDAKPGGYSRGYATALVNIISDGYEVDYRWFRPANNDPHQTLDLHPRLIRWINAGESASVTVADDGVPCVNNVRDMPNYSVHYVCRTVRLLVPADGVLTAEAVSASTGVHPLIEMEGPDILDCCYLGNPLSMTVAAGMVVKVTVEILEGSPSQTFTLTTTIR
jgi:hypothetical protein